MAIPENKDIIRNPENYDDMVRKLEERYTEAYRLAQERLGGNVADDSELLASARRELSQLSGRRDFKPLSPDQKEKKVDPSDPHVLQVRDAVTELSKRIDTAINQNPEARNALLKGRVTIGKPERTVHSAND